MSGQTYRLPRQGQWHDTLEDLEPGARPNRPPEVAPGAPTKPRRKRAVARRSREPIGPGGAYFYWCEHCNYCNTLDEGATARCANHRRTASANRKADWRRRSMASAPTTHVLGDDRVALLWQRGRALHSARKDYDLAVQQGLGPRVKPSLDRAIVGVLEAISSIPKPHSSGSQPSP